MQEFLHGSCNSLKTCTTRATGLTVRIKFRFRTLQVKIHGVGEIPSVGPVGERQWLLVGVAWSLVLRRCSAAVERTWTSSRTATREIQWSGSPEKAMTNFVVIVEDELQAPA